MKWHSFLPPWTHRTIHQMPGPCLDYRGRGTWSRWRIASVGFFGCLIAHYGLSTVAWALTITREVQDGLRLDLLDLYLYLFAPAAQAVLILIACCLAFLEAVRRFRRSIAWTGIILAASIASFSVDVAFERYQIAVCMATKSYWESGGAQHLYYTWWWYNDRWFQRRQ